MTREEKQKAIYVLKNSAPVFPLKKPEEYNDYVQAIKQVIDWLEQEPTTKNDLAVEKTDMIDKSNFSQEQYKTDLQSAYDSGYEQAKNDLEVDWESYKDVDGNSLDDLILEVLQNNFDCGNTYGYKVADEIIGLLPTVTPQETKTGYISIDDVMSVFDDFMCGEVDEEGTETFLEMLKDKAESEER